jgi:hypothetical protein
MFGIGDSAVDACFGREDGHGGSAIAPNAPPLSYVSMTLVSSVFQTPSFSILDLSEQAS